MFFANAQQVGDQIRALVAEHRPSVLALDMSRVPDIEYSALQMLMEGERRMTEEGITVWLAALNPSVLECIRSSALADRLGQERLLFNARAVDQEVSRERRFEGLSRRYLSNGIQPENANRKQVWPRRRVRLTLMSPRVARLSRNTIQRRSGSRLQRSCA